MPTLRRATAADAALIATHRHRMFADNAFSTEAELTEMQTAFEPWVRKHLAAGTYIGLFLEDDATHEVLAAAGVWLMEWPPHYLHHEPLRAYLLNFYTAPASRGQGFANQLLRAAVDAAHQAGATVLTLHASPFGKPIYEKFGFKLSNEWILKPS